MPNEKQRYQLWIVENGGQSIIRHIILCIAQEHIAEVTKQLKYMIYKLYSYVVCKINKNSHYIDSKVQLV